MTPPGNEPDVKQVLRDVRRCVAIAKLAEFENQCFRLGDYAVAKLLTPAQAAEVLQDVALANALDRTHGTELVQTLIADGLRGATA